MRKHKEGHGAFPLSGFFTATEADHGEETQVGLDHCRCKVKKAFYHSPNGPT